MISEDIFIRETDDFKRILREGKKIRRPRFILCAVNRNKISDANRLGVSIAKSDIKLASQRNRVKRVIKEMWRQKNRGHLKYKKTSDMVIIVKKGVETLNNAKIRSECGFIINQYIS